MFKSNKIFPEIPEKSRFGYINDSFNFSKEKINSYKKQLRSNGIPNENIRIESLKIVNSSLKSKHSSIFNQLIHTELKQNDLLIVVKTNQCSNSIYEFLKLQKLLRKTNSCTLFSLDLKYLFNKNVLLTIFEMVLSMPKYQDFSSNHLKIVKLSESRGRKTVITAKLIETVKYLKEVKQLPISQIAKKTFKSRNTIYKILKNELEYVPFGPYNKLIKKEERKNAKI